MITLKNKELFFDRRVNKVIFLIFQRLGMLICINNLLGNAVRKRLTGADMIDIMNAIITDYINEFHGAIVFRNSNIIPF